MNEAGLHGGLAEDYSKVKQDTGSTCGRYGGQFSLQLHHGLTRRETCFAWGLQGKSCSYRQRGHLLRLHCQGGTCISRIYYISVTVFLISSDNIQGSSNNLEEKKDI